MNLKQEKMGYLEYSHSLGVKIGENCLIEASVNWGSEPYLITIGNHVRVSREVEFYTHDGGAWVIRGKYNRPNVDLIGRIVIGNNVHIGVRAAIMPGVTIGNNCIIAPGLLSPRMFQMAKYGVEYLPIL